MIPLVLALALVHAQPAVAPPADCTAWSEWEETPVESVETRHRVCDLPAADRKRLEIEWRGPTRREFAIDVRRAESPCSGRPPASDDPYRRIRGYVTVGPGETDGEEGSVSAEAASGEWHVCYGRVRGR